MITVTVDRDFDDDGVLNGVDFCPGTVADEPSEGLGVNRWVWDGQDWITEPPKGKGKGLAFDVSMDDTMGCSCRQILDALRKLKELIE